MAAPNRLHGVLVIDKPMGPTSHDVVARLRKVLGTRAVGHAGTLDPAATGVLVVAVGEATKLSAYLTAQTKQYRATVTFGSSTTTLDAEGDIVATASIPDDLAAELRALTAGSDGTARESAAPVLARALDLERARHEQLPPAFSAIKVGGRTAHELARRGQDVPLALRPVAVSQIEITETTLATLGLLLVVSKGYYVRALARDLGQTLGVPAHLSSLRRVASGNFTLEEALPWSASCAELERAMQTVEGAAQRVLPLSRLSEDGLRRARHGQLLQETHFAEPPVPAVSAWFGPGGELVAIGRPDPNGGFMVERGFT
jgi:tRNA pseudouridine55 synthase